MLIAKPTPTAAPTRPPVAEPQTIGAALAVMQILFHGSLGATFAASKADTRKRALR